MDFRLCSEEATDVFDTIEVDTIHTCQDDESKGGEDNHHDEPDRSRRSRQPPVWYGLDEYADILVEEKVHHVADQVCHVQEQTSMTAGMKL